MECKHPRWALDKNSGRDMLFYTNYNAMCLICGAEITVTGDRNSTNATCIREEPNGYTFKRITP